MLHPWSILNSIRHSPASFFPFFFIFLFLFFSLVLFFSHPLKCRSLSSVPRTVYSFHRESHGKEGELEGLLSGDSYGILAKTKKG
jgi:hypothetical protein